jgi:uncharacterized membrane protein YjgN (DUF898 family)
VSRGADIVLVTVRELRLLLGLLLILFVTSETWRYVGRLTVFRVVGFTFATLVAALLVVGIGLRRMLERSAARRATVRVAVELLAFGSLLFATFVVVGVLSVDAELVAEWSGSKGGTLVSLGIGDPRLVITRQLLQVAAFLASLGALVFAVEVVADGGTRRVLISDLMEPADGT